MSSASRRPRAEHDASKRSRTTPQGNTAQTTPLSSARERPHSGVPTTTVIRPGNAEHAGRVEARAHMLAIVTSPAADATDGRTATAGGTPAVGAAATPSPVSGAPDGHISTHGGVTWIVKSSIGIPLAVRRSDFGDSRLATDDLTRLAQTVDSLDIRYVRDPQTCGHSFFIIADGELAIVGIRQRGPKRFAETQRDANTVLRALILHRDEMAAREHSDSGAAPASPGQLAAVIESDKAGASAPTRRRVRDRELRDPE